MPTIADFAVVQDGGFTLPGGLLNDREFLNLRLPAVSTGSPAVLMFRVDPVETPVRVVIVMNDVDVLDQTFDSTQQRTWHEVIGAGTLQPTGNELTFAVLAPGGGGTVGSATFSDVVVLFQATVP